MVGRLERVPLREVWRHEALHFTRWLEENIDVLNEAVDLNLSVVEREHAAGTFSVDLVAEDELSRTIVIENQLEKSDHDHLGKLLTYATQLEARVAIWIVADPRPEHVSVIAWLNESTPLAAYLLKLEAIRIGSSEPAALITQIVGPSDDGREAAETKLELAEQQSRRQRFWAQLLERANAETPLHSNVSPSRDNWVQAGSGRSGIHYTYWITQRDARIHLAIERPDAQENRAIFEQLISARDEIEASFREPLEWDRREGVKRCLIQKTLDVGGYKDDESNWPDIQDQMVDAMIRLQQSLRDHIDRLDM